MKDLEVQACKAAAKVTGGIIEIWHDPARMMFVVIVGTDDVPRFKVEIDETYIPCSVNLDEYLYTKIVNGYIYELEKAGKNLYGRYSLNEWLIREVR